jgi:hypothetical protein
MRFDYDPISRADLDTGIEHADPAVRRLANAVQYLSKHLLRERILSISAELSGSHHGPGASVTLWLALQSGHTALPSDLARELHVLSEQCGGWWDIPDDVDEEPQFLDEVDWAIYVNGRRGAL